MQVTAKIKENIRNIISNEKEDNAEVIFFLLDEHLGLIDEEYNQCLFAADEFGDTIYDAAMYSVIEASIFMEINRQLDEARK